MLMLPVFLFYITREARLTRGSLVEFQCVEINTCLVAGLRVEIAVVIASTKTSVNSGSCFSKFLYRPRRSNECLAFNFVKTYVYAALFRYSKIVIVSV